MGVSGNFWDLLKPYARLQGFDFLRNKRVAIDLSYWIVQHETAVKSNVLNPHLRLTFFRTINLFSRFGAFPIFVVDGTPSPLKSQMRIARFFRGSGVDISSLPVAEEGVSVERNHKFVKCVEECIELIKLFGMPVLRAKGEAEALCAQLNKEGHVDACITADSDAFLFGANCVIKSLRPNTKEPLECYYMSDIEAGLGLKRKHLIAISLLVGNDYDSNGVEGIGLETALRFVKSFSEDEILNKLHEIGRSNKIQFEDDICSLGCSVPGSDEIARKTKGPPHCSLCGHPGSKRMHLKFPCEYCNLGTVEGCSEKLVSFKCNCSSCDMDRQQKQQKKNENWEIKVCEKISRERNFPNENIIGIYLPRNQETVEDAGHSLSWDTPNVEMLVDFLNYYQNWDPSYIRQRIFPMLSTIFLREMALNPTDSLLHEQYLFDSIHRVKIKFGHQLYVVKWKKATPAASIAAYTILSKEACERGQSIECIDIVDEPDIPEVQFSSTDGCSFMLTDEDMELVRAAFPEKVDLFLKEKELKEMKSRRKQTGIRSNETPAHASATSSKSVQLSIKEFYRTSKLQKQEKLAEGSSKILGSNSDFSSKSKGGGALNKNLTKSARRRLLFD
ncbi:flap endonuclease GEN-like 1 [Apium graveolens]|uniref:flap endonuclease GEN-like 1 n=1 Tax=Apium graveolens TaxID=4045 RepID=UPI003D79AD8D